MLKLITQAVLIVVEVVVTVRRHVHVVDVEDAQGRVERLLRARVQTGCRKQTGHDQATVPGLIPTSILVKYKLRHYHRSTIVFVFMQYQFFQLVFCLLTAQLRQIFTPSFLQWRKPGKTTGTREIKN